MIDMQVHQPLYQGRIWVVDGEKMEPGFTTPDEALKVLCHFHLNRRVGPDDFQVGKDLVKAWETNSRRSVA